MTLPRWVGRTFFGRLQSRILSRVPEEPNNYSLQTPSAKAFDYCRSSVSLHTQSYLFGYFEVIHAYYKHVTCPNINNDLPPKSNEAGNFNLNLFGFWWQVLYIQLNIYEAYCIQKFIYIK